MPASGSALPGSPGMTIAIPNDPLSKREQLRGRIMTAIHVEGAPPGLSVLCSIPPYYIELYTFLPETPMR
jgi:hypothetical protein